MSSGTSKEISFFERHPLVTLGLVILSAVLLLDVGAGYIYRKIRGYSWSERLWQEEKTYRVPSSVYHHKFSSLKSVDRARWGNDFYKVYTNSLGFKDKTNRKIPLRIKQHRVLFIGDSFTEGVGFNFEDTFVGVIAQNLEQRNIEVLNAGVSSYSPVIYWRKTKHLIEKVGLKFNELIVYLDISDVQDEASIYFLSKKEHVLMRSNSFVVYVKRKKRVFLESMKGFIRNNMILGQIVFFEILDIERMDINEWTYERSGWTIDDELYSLYGKRGLRKMKIYMDKLYNLLQQHQIKLVVAVYPWPEQIRQYDLYSKQVKFWEQWCNAKKVSLINYFPVFIKSGNKSEINETINKYFIRKDVHWNKEGHRKVAEIFLDWYLKGRKEGS